MRTVSLLFAAIVAASSSILHAAPFEFFDWQPSDSGFTAARAGITSSVEFQTAGDDILYKNVLTMTRPPFASAYGASVPTLKMDSGVAGSAGSSNTFVSFSSPLPVGARLFVFDVDIELRNEAVYLSSQQSISLLEQLETQSGATSGFPSWSPTLKSLTATSNNANNEEASIFDASGVSAVTISYRRTAGGTGMTGASFAFALPVPEPTALRLATIAAIAAAAGSGSASRSRYKNERR